MDDYFKFHGKRSHSVLKSEKNLLLKFKQLGLQDNVIHSVIRKEDCVPYPKFEWKDEKCIENKSIDFAAPKFTIPTFLTKEEFLTTENIKEIFIVLEEICKFAKIKANFDFKNLIKVIPLEQLYVYYKNIYIGFIPILSIEQRKYLYNLEKKSQPKPANNYTLVNENYINVAKKIIDKKTLDIILDTQVLKIKDTNDFATLVNSWTLLKILEHLEYLFYLQLKFMIDTNGDSLINIFKLQEEVLYYVDVKDEEFKHNINLFRNHVLDIIYNYLPKYNRDMKRYINFNIVNSKNLNESMFTTSQTKIQKLTIEIDNGPFEPILIGETCENNDPYSFILEPCIDLQDKTLEEEFKKLEITKVMQYELNKDIKSFNKEQTSLYLENPLPTEKKTRGDHLDIEPLNYFEFALSRTPESYRVDDSYWQQEILDGLEILHEDLLKSINYNWYITLHFKQKLQVNKLTLNNLLVRYQNLLTELELELVDRIEGFVENQFHEDVINYKSTFSDFIKSKHFMADFYHLVDLRQAWYHFANIKYGSIYLFDYKSIQRINYQLDYNYQYWLSTHFVDNLVDIASQFNQKNINKASDNLRDWIKTVIVPKMKYYYDEAEEFDTEEKPKRSQFTFEPVRFIRGKRLNPDTM